MTTKTQKTTKPAFVPSVYSDLGFRVSHNDAAAIAAIKALAKKNVDAAKGAFQSGYVAGRMNPDADSLTPDMLAKAQALIKATGATSTGKVKPGSFRRSPEQEKLYTAARVAWSRLAKDAGIARADRRGGARKRKEEPKDVTPAAGTPKTPAKTVTVGKVATVKDLVSGVHAFKGAWAALMVASKPLTLTAEASALAIKIAEELNKLEGILATSK